MRFIKVHGLNLENYLINIDEIESVSTTKGGNTCLFVKGNFRIQEVLRMEKDYSALAKCIISNLEYGLRLTRYELVAYCIGRYGFVDDDLFEKINKLYVEKYIDA